MGDNRWACHSETRLRILRNERARLRQIPTIEGRTGSASEPYQGILHIVQYTDGV